MKRTWITWAGLAVVAVAAAVLSFDALRRLAALAGTPAGLAPLLPITIDAAAVVATRVWLAGEAPRRAWRFARVLALTMVALSVAGNAVSHWLVTYRVEPAWWAVVAVASVPPLVLGAVAHLAHLAATPTAPGEAGEAAGAAGEPVVTSGERAGPTGVWTDPTPTRLDLPHHPHQPVGEPCETGEPSGDHLVNRARTLVATHGRLGRARLARELGCTEHQARQVLTQLDAERPTLTAIGGEPR